MGNWRALFESNLRPVGERKYGEEYVFGPPATAAQAAAAEQALGVQFPADVREWLSECNGIWSTSTVSRQLGSTPDIAYLDTRHLSVDVPAYLAEERFAPGGADGLLRPTHP